MAQTRLRLAKVRLLASTIRSLSVRMLRHLALLQLQWVTMRWPTQPTAPPLAI